MKVSEVIKLACIFTNRQDLLDTQFFDEEIIQSPSSEQSKEINTFVRCLNLVVGEIACDYLPLLKEEEIEVTNGKITYSDFDLMLIEVVKIVDINGKSVKFKNFADYIQIPNGKYVITYSYIPDQLEFEDDMQQFYGRIPERVFAYGVAMEYSLLNSLFDEMEIWQTRFKDSLRIAMQKHCEKRLPKRGWF